MRVFFSAPQIQLRAEFREGKNIMVKTIKDVKMSEGNKENIRPIRLMKITSEERAKRSKKYVILTKKQHCKYSNSKNKKKKSARQNTQMKAKNKSSVKINSKIKIPSTKVDKATTILKSTNVQETEANATDYLKNAAQKSLHEIPLTHIELKHLFNKYKRDGHYRMDTSLPPFTSFMDNREEDTNVTLQTPTQTKTPDYKTSPEYSNNNSPYRYQYTSSENPADLQVDTDLRVNDIDTYTFIQQNTPSNENYDSSFSNTYTMDYNNTVSIPNTLHDPTRMQSSDSFSQFYSDNENPYDLSYRTSYSSMSDSNTACDISGFGNEHFQDNTLQALGNTAKNNLKDYNNLRNHNFVDSYIPPINPTCITNNNDCLNIHNSNVSLSVNKDNGFVGKLCNVITQIWDNKQLAQVFPGGNIDCYSSRKPNTNDPSLCQLQGSTIMKNHSKQYGALADMNTISHSPQVTNHVYHPCKNPADINNNFSTVPLENMLSAPTFMIAPVLAPNLLYDTNNF